jgi:hypothetical protein
LQKVLTNLSTANQTRKFFPVVYAICTAPTHPCALLLSPAYLQQQLCPNLSSSHLERCNSVNHELFHAKVSISSESVSPIDQLHDFFFMDLPVPSK